MRALPEGTAVRPRRGRTALLVVVGLLLAGLGELALMITVGRHLGVLPTVLLVVVMSAIGLVLLRREGARTWRSLRETTRSGGIPSKEIADAVLVLVGGALLVLPGFVSDVIGLVLVLPVTRPLARPLLEAAVARRVFRDLGVVRVSRTQPTRRSTPDEVIEGEIID